MINVITAQVVMLLQYMQTDMDIVLVVIGPGHMKVLLNLTGPNPKKIETTTHT
jgi:hypothetical protein